MAEKGYNGWANYETWNIELWLGNDEGLYHARMRFIRSACDEITAADVEAFCCELFPNGTPDMVGGAKDMALVDWQEIADHWEAERTDE